MSGGRAKRRKKQAWRKTQGLRMPNICRNCGEPGPHFVPPSFGDPGFYICEAKS